LRLQEHETVEIAYFPFDQLPAEMLFGHKKRIEDAIKGECAASVRQQIQVTDLKRYTRKELYEARDQSGLTRQQFYLQRLVGAEINEVVEVGNT